MKKAQNPWEKYINDSTLENVYGDIDVIYRIFDELGTSIKELEIPRSLGLLSDGLDHIEDINYNTLSKMVEIKKNFYDYNDSIDQIDNRYKAKMDELGVPSLESVEMDQFVPREALISTGTVATSLDVSGGEADAVETDGVNTENIEDVDLVDPNGGNSDNNNNNNNDDDKHNQDVDDIIIVTSPPEQKTTPHEIKTTPVVDDGDNKKLKLSDALGILGGVAIASGAAVGTVAAAKAAKKKKEEKEEDSVWEN